MNIQVFPTVDQLVVVDGVVLTAVATVGAEGDRVEAAARRRVPSCTWTVTSSAATAASDDRAGGDGSGSV